MDTKCHRLTNGGIRQMNKVLTMLALTGLVGCGAPENFINIDVGQDGKNGRNGVNGKDGADSTSFFYFNEINLGEIDWIVADVAQLATSNDYKVQLHYSMTADEWQLPTHSGNVIFYPNSVCTENTGYVTRLHSRYASDVIVTYLADNQYGVAMVDRVNLYNDVVKNNSAIGSARITGAGYSICLSDSDILDGLKLASNTVFKLNDSIVTGWDSNFINIDASQTEER